MKSTYQILFIVSSVLLNACSKYRGHAITFDSQAVESNCQMQHHYVIQKGGGVFLTSSFSWKSHNEVSGKISTNGALKSRKIVPTEITESSGFNVIYAQVIKKERRV